MNNRPIILVFGMPRSGTTWIGKIFDSHKRTLYRHEPDTWDKISQIPLLETINNADKYCDFVTEYVDKFVESNRPEISGKLPFFRKSYSSLARQGLFRASVLLSGAVSRLNREIRLPIIRPISGTQGEDYVVVWKSIQLLGRLGVIMNCLPHAKCIQIVRHPCGYVSSVLSGERHKKFVSHLPASEDYSLFERLLETIQANRYGLTMDILKQLSPEERLAWRWVLFNEKAMDDTVGQQNTKILKYEDMCKDPVETAKDYFEFCGLEWCDQTNQFLSSSTSKNSESYYSVFKDPEKAAYKWKQELTSKQVESIENVVAKSSIGNLYRESF